MDSLSNFYGGLIVNQLTIVRDQNRAMKRLISG